MRQRLSCACLRSFLNAMNPTEPTSPEELSFRYDSERLDASQLSHEEMLLVREWESLGSELRALPVSAARLDQSVMGAIRGGDAVVVGAATDRRVGGVSGGLANDRRQRSLIASFVSVVALACSLSVLSVMPTFPPTSVSAFASLNVDSLAEELSQCDVVLVRVPQEGMSPVDLLSDSLELPPTDGDDDVSMPLLSFDQEGDDLFDDLADFERITNPDYIGEMTREELFAKLVEAVETPSLAEEHFGEIVVLFPRDLMEEIKEKSRAETETDDLPQPPETREKPIRRKVFVVLRALESLSDDVDPDVSMLVPPESERHLLFYTGV